MFQANPGYLSSFSLDSGWRTNFGESYRQDRRLHNERKYLFKRCMDISTTQDIVKLCDYYRTGKNLGHIRAKLYFEMGIDTWQKFAYQTSEGIIAKFAEYIKSQTS